MGRSVTCTYQVHVNFTNGGQLHSSQSCYGAMSLSQVRGILLSEQNYQKERGKGLVVLNAEFWPQTKRGERFMQKDYAIMDLEGNVTHHNIV